MYSAFSLSAAPDQTELNWASPLKCVELSSSSQRHIQRPLICLEYVLDVQILFTFIIQIKRHTAAAPGKLGRKFTSHFNRIILEKYKLL